ncbi:MAG: hypothetical protein HC880_00560 [Bacteroidia bacterium]|nr:hypothetical protein [Bacteroidia bacterium]
MNEFDWQIFSPLARPNLLRGALNKKILDISTYFQKESSALRWWDKLINGEITPEGFFKCDNNFTIKFEGGLNIDLFIMRKNFMFIKRANRFGHKWGHFTTSFATTPTLYSVKDELLQGLDIYRAIGQTVENIIICRLDQNISYGNPYGIPSRVPYAIEFELSNGQSLVVGGVEFEKKTSAHIFCTTNQYSIFKNLKKSETKVEHMYPERERNYSSDYYIHELEAISFLEEHYPHNTDLYFNIETGIYKKILSQNPSENYIILNNTLKSLFKGESQRAIPDLRFGLSKEGVIKIVYPFDTYPNRVLDMNINFIYALMHEIEKIAPRVLKNFYNNKTL